MYLRTTQLQLHMYICTYVCRDVSVTIFLNNRKLKKVKKRKSKEKKSKKKNTKKPNTETSEYKKRVTSRSIYLHIFVSLDL